MKAITNLPASVAARLLNRAKETDDDFQNLLTSYFLERFLYRIGESQFRERFVLKGAMLLRLWSDRPYRATLDLDLLRLGEGTHEAIQEDIKEIIAAKTAPDAVSFDPAHIRIEPIRVEDEYAGARVNLPARCGNAKVDLQIDLGVGDSVWPPPVACTYPTLLEFPAPKLLAYPREAVVAEKLEAMVVLGDRNSRIKDFFDLHYLAKYFSCDGKTLCEAVRRTFKRRGTPIPTEVPIGITQAYWENPSRPAQIRAFIRRAKLSAAENPGKEFVQVLYEFLEPVLDDLRRGDQRVETWTPGGPWAILKHSF